MSTLCLALFQKQELEPEEVRDGPCLRRTVGKREIRIKQCFQGVIPYTK